MRSVTRRTGLLALLAVLVTGLAAAVAVAQRGPQSQPDRAPRVGVPGTVLPAADASPEIKQRFGVLRRAARTGDLPTDAGSSPDVDRTYVQASGLNLKHGRRLSGTKPVYVVPGEGVVCTLYGGESASCTPNEAVGQDFQVQTCGAVPQGVVSVSGLVPDGVRTALIRRSDGGGTEVAVQGNYLDASVPVIADGDIPTAVEYGGQAFPVPAVSLGEMTCTIE